MFDDSGVVGEEAELSDDGACGLAYVYAGDSAIDENTESFLPDSGKVQVHGVVDPRDSFLAAISFQFFLQRRDSGVHLAELVIPHPYHRVRRRSHHEMHAGVG